MRIKFGKNEIPYGQDMGMHSNIPMDVIFQTTKEMEGSDKGRLTLTADGYGFGVKGQPPGNYGNGFITVSKNDLLVNRHQWEIIEEKKKMKLKLTEECVKMCLDCLFVDRNKACKDPDCLVNQRLPDSYVLPSLSDKIIKTNYECRLKVVDVKEALSKYFKSPGGDTDKEKIFGEGLIYKDGKEMPVIIEKASERKECQYCNTGRIHKHIVTVDKGIVNYIKSLGEFKDFPLNIKETKKKSLSDKLKEVIENYKHNYGETCEEAYKYDLRLIIEEVFKEAVKEFLRRFSSAVAEIPPPYDLVKEIFGEKYLK